MGVWWRPGSLLNGDQVFRGSKSKRECLIFHPDSTWLDNDNFETKMIRIRIKKVRIGALLVYKLPNGVQSLWVPIQTSQFNF